MSKRNSPTVHIPWHTGGAVDVAYCEVDGCGSTDDVQPELLPSYSRIDPPEWRDVCARHRAIREANEAYYEAQMDDAALLDGPDTL